MEEETKLPLTIVKRLIKNTLSPNFHGTVEKDAALAISASSTVFVTYVTAFATAAMKEKKRSVLTVEDIFGALEEIDFGDFVEPVKSFLQDFKLQQARKKEQKLEHTLENTGQFFNSTDKTFIEDGGQLQSTKITSVSDLLSCNEESRNKDYQDSRLLPGVQSEEYSTNSQPKTVFNDKKDTQDNIEQSNHSPSKEPSILSLIN